MAGLFRVSMKADTDASSTEITLPGTVFLPTMPEPIAIALPAFEAIVRGRGNDLSVHHVSDWPGVFDDHA